MAKFDPPKDEKDRRLMARALYAEGKSAEEIARITQLDEKVVKNVIKWLETTEYGKKWIGEYNALRGSKAKPGAPQGQEESGPEAPPEEPQTISPVTIPSHEREAGRSPAPTLEDVVASAGQTPSRQRDAVPRGTPQIRETVIVDRTDQLQGQRGTPAVGGGGLALEVQEDAAEIPPDPVTGKIAQTFVTPTTIYWYQYLRGKGYDKPMHQFLEECVVGFFKARGLRMAVVQEFVS